MSDPIYTIIYSIITSIFSTSFLIILGQNLITKNIEKSLDFKYNKKLEDYKTNLSKDLECYKSDLKSKNDRELENLRSEYGRSLSIQSGASH